MLATLWQPIGAEKISYIYRQSLEEFIDKIFIENRQIVFRGQKNS